MLRSMDERMNLVVLGANETGNPTRHCTHMDQDIFKLVPPMQQRDEPPPMAGGGAVQATR
jgi:hypothetical protein